MLIPGFATTDGTARFRARHESRLPSHFRSGHGLWISSIGLGTYLGDPTEEWDQLYTDAVKCAAELGINVFDTAINYRHQRSERAIAAALKALFEAGTTGRDEIVIATKGGFLSFDGAEPEDPSAYFYQNLIKPGLVRQEDVSAGCHVMSPQFLEDQIERSRGNLGLQTLDIYYLHNPETQLSDVPREEVYRRLRTAFAVFEKAVADGKIRQYGTATWNAYRQTPDSSESIPLAEVLRAAEEVGGKDHHFRAVQLPFNFAMPEALAVKSQMSNGKPVSLLELARSHELEVFASASIMQGHLAKGLPAQVRKYFPPHATDAQCAIQFVRSTPGITCALVGMGHREHVEENLATARVAPFSLQEFRSLFAK